MIPEKYRKDEEIIRLTIEQIEKDFGTILPELVFSGDQSVLFNELTEQLSVALRGIKKNSMISFRSLLYKVDIRESEVKKLEDGLSSNPNSYFHALAEKIIQREFQKILTRKYFSGKE